MVVDPKAAAVFEEERAKDDLNTVCADCGTDDATWASVTHGIYLSIGAAGVHRSLGVRVSFVQSTSMDSWRPDHLRMMQLGGNRRFADFLQRHGVPSDMPIRQKYRTRAAAWYREDLRARADGLPGAEREEPERGTGHLPEEGSTPERHGAVLDEVFSSVHQSGAPSAGVGARLPPGSTTVSFASAAGAGGLPGLGLDAGAGTGAIIRARSAHVGKSKRKVTSFPDWVSKQLDKITATKGERAAAKLKKMSTGNMEGFGPEDSASGCSPEDSQPVHAHSCDKLDLCHHAAADDRPFSSDRDGRLAISQQQAAVAA